MPIYISKLNGGVKYISYKLVSKALKIYKGVGLLSYL